MNRQYAQAWKFLKQQLARVQDPILRNTMLAEFRQRALSEWGFDPDNGKLAQDEDIVLTDWEQDLLQDIERFQTYGIKNKARMKAVEAEAIENMRQFIRDGGSLADIPADIRSPHIDELYYECLVSMGKDTMAQADQVIAAGPTEPIDVSDQDPFGGKKPTLESMTEWISKGGFWFNLPIEMQTQKNKDLYMQAMRQG